MSQLRDLAPRLQIHILTYCDADELFTCAKVCRAWYEYLVQEEPWYALSAANTRRALCTRYTIHGPRVRSTGRDGGQTRRPRAFAREPFGLRFAEHAFVTESHDAARGNGHDGDEDSDTLRPHQVGLYGRARASSRPVQWARRIRCPIPPAPQAASLASDFQWTSIERRFDGGHGGAREYYMRCLRYIAFDARTCYGTDMGLDDGASEDEEAWGEGDSASTSPAHSSDHDEISRPGSTAAGWSESRGPQPYPSTGGVAGGARGGTGWQQPSPWSFFEPTPNPAPITTGPTDLLDELFGFGGQTTATVPPHPTAGSRALKPRTSQTQREAAARQASFDACYECKCFRRWQAAQPGGSIAKLAPRKTTTTTTTGSGAYGYGADGDTAAPRRPLFLLSPNRFCLISPSPRVWSTGLLRHLRLASEQRRERQRAVCMDRRQREAMRDGSEGLFVGSTMSLSFRVEFYTDARRRRHSQPNTGGSGGESSVSCFIGFVDAAEVYRFELQPTVASLAARRAAFAREQAGTVGASGSGSGGRYGAFASTASRHTGGCGGRPGGGSEADDEVADMLAALADDIQSREGAGGAGEEDPTLANARRWWTMTAPAEADARGGRSGRESNLFASHAIPSNTDGGGPQLRGGGARTSGEPGLGARGQPQDGEAGGVFIGDCPGSYGLNVVNGCLYQNGHAFVVARPRCRAEDDIFTLRFNFEDDHISLHDGSGDQVAIVLVDAFSEGQTWVPAVSCRGCGVTVLPPTLSLP